MVLAAGLTVAQPSASRSDPTPPPARAVGAETDDLEQLAEAARAHLVEGRLAEAEAGFADLVEQAMRRFGPHHPLVADGLAGQAYTAERARGPAAGEPFRRREVATREALGDPDALAMARAGLGMNLFQQRRPQEALEPLAAADAAMTAWPYNDTRLRVLLSHAEVLNALRRYDEALAVLEPADTVVRLLPDRPRQGQALADALAMVLYNADRFVEAEVAGRRACDAAMTAGGGDRTRLCRPLVLAEEALGLERAGMARPTEADVEAFRRMLAAGDFAGADARLEAIVTAFEAVDGPADEQVLALKAMRARLLSRLGRAREAATLLDAAYPVALAALGQDHKETLYLLTAYGETLAQVGRQAEAPALNEAALGPAVARWGEDSPEATTVRGQLADALSEMGRYEEALALYRRVQAALADRPLRDTRRRDIERTMAYARIMTGDHAGGEAQAAAVVQALEADGRGDSPATDSVRLVLAEAQMIDGRIAAARALYQGVLERRSVDQANERGQRALALAGLAMTEYSDGRLDAAERAVTEALAILASEAPGGAVESRVRRLHGRLLIEMGRSGEAVNFIRATLAQEEDRFGETHPELSTTLIVLADALYEDGRADAALEALARAVRIAETGFGPEHSFTGGAWNQSGLMAFRLGRLETAEVQFRRALEIHQAALGPDHPLTLTARANLAGVLAAGGRRREAADLYQAVLDDRARVLGADHPDVGHLLNTIALQLEEELGAAQVEAMLRRAVEIGDARLPASHPDRIQWTKNLAYQLLLDDQPTEALTLLRSAMRGSSAIAGGRRDRETLGAEGLDDARDLNRGFVIAAWSAAEALR